MKVDWAPEDPAKRYVVTVGPAEPAPTLSDLVAAARAFLEPWTPADGLSERAIENALWFLDHARPGLTAAALEGTSSSPSHVVHEGHEPSGMRRRHITVDDHLLTVPVHRDAQAAFARWLEDHRAELRTLLADHGVDIDLLLQPVLERHLSDGDVALLAGR